MTNEEKRSEEILFPSARKNPALLARPDRNKKSDVTTNHIGNTISS